MKVTLWGMPKNSDFDLFVIQTPNKPFGVSWYQSDIHAGNNGSGTAVVQGIFDKVIFPLVAKKVLDASFVVQTKLGPGLLESVYEVVLAHELRKPGILVELEEENPPAISL